MAAMDTTAPAGYSTREACETTGVTYRQLDHWVRVGLVRASIADAKGSGSYRRFSAHDLAIVRVLAAVRGTNASGMPLDRMTQLAEFLRDLPLQRWAATVLVMSVDGDVWLQGDAAPKVGIHVDLSLVFDSVDA